MRRSSAVIAVLLAAQWASANMITNGGFETGTLDGWSTFGQGWRTGTGADAHGGTAGAVCDVLTNNTDEWRGMFQNVAVTTGLTYSGSMWIRSVAVESSESWFELQWLNSSGGVISQTQTVHVSADQPYTQMLLENQVAPGGAVTASVRGIVHMISTPAEGSDFHTMDDIQFNAVPEPGTLALVVGGVAVLAAGRKGLRL